MLNILFKYRFKKTFIFINYLYKIAFQRERKIKPHSYDIINFYAFYEYIIIYFKSTFKTANKRTELNNLYS